MESCLYNYEKSMHEQMEILFQSLDAEDEVFENIEAEFMKLMEVRQDPPFEVIWIYSSPMCKGSVLVGKDFEGRISLMKSIFTGICEKTSSSGVSKSIAMLAPICLWISGLFVYVYASEFESGMRDEMLMDIRSFVDLILGHVSVCCSSSNDDDRSYRLCKPLEDLLALWMGDKKGRTSLLTCTFSSLSDEIRLRLSKVGVEVSELSGAVAAQLFLMRMGMSLQNADANAKMSDLEKELKRWGVAALTGLRNLDLFVMLLQILLEREPFTGTLGSEIGPSLRAVLFDVVSVDYAFLDPEGGDQRSSVHLKNIAFLRLLVSFEAVEFFREMGDHSKAISCENAFSTSRLSAKIVKLVPSGVGLNKCKRTGSSPKAFLKWLLKLEQQGVKVFSDSTTKYSSKLSLKLTKRGRDLPVKNQPEAEDSNADDSKTVFSIDKAAEEVETESEEELDKVSSAFITAANSMNAADEPNKAIKRKSSSSGNGKKKQKITDTDLSDSSGEEESSDKDESNSSDDADADESKD
ncbi:hypothetical protein V2J09_012328 [Rumex salicifolius]